MTTEIVNNTEERMKKCNELFQIQIKKIHTGRITPNILDSIKIKIKHHKKETYTPLQYLANITTKNAHTLIITVFDSSIVKNIEKTIINSDLNLNTSSNKNIIYVYLPVLTEERRKQLIKLVHNESERTKISIRNIRRSANEKIKKSIKNKIINEEKEHYLQNRIQTLTDTWIKTINQIIEKKEIELKNI